MQAQMRGKDAMNMNNNTQKEFSLRTASSIFGDAEVTIEKQNVEIGKSEISFSVVFDLPVREICLLAADYAVVRKIQAGKDRLWCIRP